jgi:hypothetical protein
MPISSVRDVRLDTDVRSASSTFDATDRHEVRGSSVSTVPISREIFHGHRSRAAIMASSWPGVGKIREPPAFTNAVRVTIHDAWRRSANRRKTLASG